MTKQTSLPSVRPRQNRPLPLFCLRCVRDNINGAFGSSEVLCAVLHSLSLCSVVVVALGSRSSRPCLVPSSPLESGLRFVRGGFKRYLRFAEVLLFVRTLVDSRHRRHRRHRRFRRSPPLALCSRLFALARCPWCSPTYLRCPLVSLRSESLPLDIPHAYRSSRLCRSVDLSSKTSNHVRSTGSPV
jgi:hypothetical protein